MISPRFILNTPLLCHIKTRILILNATTLPNYYRFIFSAKTVIIRQHGALVTSPALVDAMHGGTQDVSGSTTLSRQCTSLMFVSTSGLEVSVVVEELSSLSAKLSLSSSP